MTIYNRPYYTIFFQYRPIILCDTLWRPNRQMLWPDRGFPQSQLSWRWRNYQRFIPSFKVFGHLSFLIKTTFHSFVTFISIYCIGINRAYMYLTHIRTFAGKSPCMFIFFLFNKLSLLTVTLYLWKNKFYLIPCVSK